MMWFWVYESKEFHNHDDISLHDSITLGITYFLYKAIAMNIYGRAYGHK